MAPSAVIYGANNRPKSPMARFSRLAKSAVLHRNLKKVPPIATGTEGNRLVLQEGRRILDVAGGAAVTCLGYDGYKMRMGEAFMKQLDVVSYVPPQIASTTVMEDFAKFMVDSTMGKMTKFAMYSGTGSDCVEAAIKLSRQYHLEKPKPEPGRVNFIAREGSYHGNTGFALSLSGHNARRKPYEFLLQKKTRFHHIPAVNEFRDRHEGETDAEYNSRKAEELRQKILELRPETVAAYFMEPVVGATLGCVGAPKGYLKAIAKVCREYGVLLVFDEIMCGMGRTGTLHAWQYEGVAPDIQTVGKCLGGGVLPASGMLVGPTVANVLFQGSGAFIHGHTFDNHSILCAIAYEVQKIIEDDDLLKNVREMGELLIGLLKQRLGHHVHVGDVRGRGLFVGIEFVLDRVTKECFPRQEKVVERYSEMALSEPNNLHVYTGCGETVNGDGDHIILAPSFNITETEIREIVDKVCRLIEDFDF